MLWSSFYLIYSVFDNEKCIRYKMDLPRAPQLLGCQFNVWVSKAASVFVRGYSVDTNCHRFGNAGSTLMTRAAAAREGGLWFTSRWHSWMTAAFPLCIVSLSSSSLIVWIVWGLQLVIVGGLNVAAVVVVLRIQPLLTRAIIIISASTGAIV